MTSCSISSVLREAYTDYGASFNMELARATRKRQMRERRAASSTADGAPQSWRDLARGIPPSTPGYSEHATLYRKFLASVATALGGEASPAEVGEASKLAFRAVQAGRAAQGDSGSSSETDRPSGRAQQALGNR